MVGNLLRREVGWRLPPAQSTRPRRISDQVRRDAVMATCRVRRDRRAHAEARGDRERRGAGRSSMQATNLGDQRTSEARQEILVRLQGAIRRRVRASRPHRVRASCLHATVNHTASRARSSQTASVAG